MKFLLLPCLLLTAGSALAQNFLEPLVVTASKTKSSLADTGYAATYFSKEDFLNNTVRTLPDALRYTPGVLVQKTSHGHGSPYIRGFTGRQNLLMIDGVRFNNSTFRSGPIQYWNTIDALSLDHFELIRSQGSVLYGSDAAGGTMNAFTKYADFKNEDKGAFFNHGSTYYEYRSNGQGSHIGRLESQTGIGGVYGLHLGVSAKEFGDIEDSSVGRMRGTGYPEQAVDARFDYAIDPQTTFTFLHQNFNQDAVSRWHSTSNNPGWTHGSHVIAPGTYIARDYDQERSLTYARIVRENDQVDSFVQRLSATLSYQTSTDSELQTRTLTDIRNQVTEVNTTGFDLELESKISNGTLVYGFDYYNDSVDTTATRNSVFRPGDRPVADDSSYDLLGAYAQYLRPLGEKLELTGGVRYTHARAELGKFFDDTALVDRSAEDSWDDLSASLRATYKLNEQWLAYAGISQAFRAPNLNDLSGNQTSLSGTPALGSLSVTPEEFLTYELGVKRAGKHYGMGAAIFYTDITDVITGVPSAPLSAINITTNGSDGYIYGAELEAYWNIGEAWTLTGFAAWQDGRNTTPDFIGGPSSDGYISRLLPLSGSVALRWQEPENPYWLETRIAYSDQADRLSADNLTDKQRIPTDGTPGYTVISVRAGWNPTENLELTAAVENLMDQDHRLHGSGQNEPGLNAIVGAKLTW